MRDVNRLKPPLGQGPQAITAWLHQHAQAGTPSGKIYLAVLGVYSMDPDEAEVLRRAEADIGALLVARNLDGREAEKRGDIQRALELYEANVQARFDGSHPYERLRILHARAGQFRDAIRVCQTYLDDVAADPDLCKSFRSWIRKYSSILESARE